MCIRDRLYSGAVEFRFNENPLNIDKEKMEEREDKEDLDWCDVFFTQNLANFGGPATIRYVGLAKEMGKFVWYDTDDLLTNIYDDHRTQRCVRAKQPTRDYQGNLPSL